MKSRKQITKIYKVQLRRVCPNYSKTEIGEIANRVIGSALKKIKEAK